MIKIFWILGFLICFDSAYAQKGSSGATHYLSFGMMFLNSETVQGGNGPSGSTLLTQTDFVRTWKKLGYGVVFNYDKHGKYEVDSSYGIKLEFIHNKFYIEAAYLLNATRAYTDRSIAEETGDGLMYGVGARFPMGKSAKGPYFHVSYKIKTQTLKKQDGTDLSDPIKQSDGYPLIGFGYNF